MTIHWHKRAATQLHEVENYVLRDFGERVRQEFMDDIEQATLSLADMPTMGKLDPLFVHRRLAYRKGGYKQTREHRRTLCGGLKGFRGKITMKQILK